MEVKGNCSVLIIGVGGVGQWGVRLARALYPTGIQIICADLKNESLDTVVDHDIDVVPLLLSRSQTTKDTVQRVKTASITGRGVDFVLDFVGASETFNIAKSSLRKLGRYHVTGLMGGEVVLSVVEMVMKQISMHGVLVGTLVQLKRLVELVEKMPSVCANLPYSVHPLEDAPNVMQKLADGEVTGRAILRCGDDTE